MSAPSLAGQMSQSQESSTSADSEPENPLVLNASVHDVWFFTALMRGINFASRANVTITKAGLVVTTEEARTLLGTTFIFAEVFDEYIYNPYAAGAPGTQDSNQSGQPPNTAFEIPLNTIVECLNVFGTANPSNASTNAKPRRWRRVGEDEDADGAGASGRQRRQSGAAGTEDTTNRRIDQYFGKEKTTGVRISYAGPGYPLTFLIAEETVGGATATVEVATFDPEPQLELPFDADRAILKIILKSSWLREALSEIDPSCEKLTIIGNPPPPNGRAPRASSQPRLRLKAVGTFGSTEMDYPSDKEVLETCECASAVSFSYSFKHISKTMRAVSSSTKTSLRIDDEGLLSLQFQMPRTKEPEAREAFIEFRCLALDDSS